MKILHVWDQAGVSCLLALYQRKLGHQADVIMREEFSAGMLELYGLTEKMVFLNEKIDPLSPIRKAYYRLPKQVQGTIRPLKRKMRSLRFYFQVSKMAHSYDVIHIHSCWMAVFLLPFKKKIIHWHGDECRVKPCLTPKFKWLLTHFFIKFYSRNHEMYVSTPDILSCVPKSVWLPNPVDINLFHERNLSKPNTALYCLNWYEDGSHAQKIAKAEELDLTILDRRNAKNWIRHEYFADYLAAFEFYIDRQAIPSLSKTALEALSLGLKVVQGWDNKIIEGLNPRHDPEVCARRTLEIYERLLA